MRSDQQSKMKLAKLILITLKTTKSKSYQ